jgi:hypothetical protein
MDSTAVAQDTLEPVETVWCGVPRFHCPICGRDSESYSTVIEHIKEVCGAPQAMSVTDALKSMAPPTPLPEPVNAEVSNNSVEQGAPESTSVASSLTQDEKPEVVEGNITLAESLAEEVVHP